MLIDKLLDYVCYDTTSHEGTGQTAVGKNYGRVIKPYKTIFFHSNRHLFKYQICTDFSIIFRKNQSEKSRFQV